MYNQSKRNARVLVGGASVLFAVIAFFSWFLPYSPTVLVIGIVGTLAVSLMLSVIAGFIGSRWWFAASLLPVFLFILIVPQYEKRTEVTLRGGLGDVEFRLAGSGKLGSFTVFSPDYPALAKEPLDKSLAVWRVEPINGTGDGQLLWRIQKIDYGNVPQGYVQTVPSAGPPAKLQENRQYLVAAETVNAPSFFGTMQLESGVAKFVEPKGPQVCFTSENGKWVSHPCPDWVKRVQDGYRR